MMPMPPRRHCGPPTTRPKQSGAATLVVVMVLFFIVALVAAYTSRNLIFEQRTSANQYRSTQALEAAEAGLEWALTMLNSGRIDEACLPHTDPATTDPSFRQRYLSIDHTTGIVVELARSDGQPLRPSCVFNGTDWQCSCAVDPAAPVLAAPVGSGSFPAFTLRLSRNDPVYPPGSGPYPPGVVRIESTGCTRLDVAGVCAAAAGSGDGRATVTILAALKSALSTPPTAAVTAQGDLTLASPLLRAINGDRASGGFTLQVGGNIYGTPLALLGPAGTPSDRLDMQNNTTVVQGDPAMAALSANPLLPYRMFNSVFGMGRDTYRLQPATVYIRCNDDCSATTVRDIARLNPGRVLWVDDNFTIDVSLPIGTLELPVMLVVTGDIDIDVGVAGAQLNGVVYATGPAGSGGATLTNNESLTLSGALIGDGHLNLSGAGTSTVVYDADVLNRLRWTHGSFVRVPGSWRDF